MHHCVEAFKRGRKASFESNTKKLIFTPGPVSTTYAVKQALVQDLTLMEVSALNTIAYVRETILEIDNLSKEKYTVIPLQGSGTFSVEAAIHTATPPHGRVLILKNGYFGDNLEIICKSSRIAYDVLDWPEGRAMEISTVEKKLKESSTKFSTIVMVHHETSFGIMNPIFHVGRLVSQYNPNAAFVVDAVSSFGCYPIPMDEANITFMASASNKCLEGFPGIGFNIVRKDFLLKSEGNCRTAVLDLLSEYIYLENYGRHRFTWPVQVYAAFAKALSIYIEEGRYARMKRYQINNNIIRQGMKKLKFQEYYQNNVTRSVLLTTYKWPTNKNFNFSLFQRLLESEGLIIYSTSLTKTQVFRIGNMGQLNEDHCRIFLTAVERIMKTMEIENPYSE